MVELTPVIVSSRFKFGSCRTSVPSARSITTRSSAKRSSSCSLCSMPTRSSSGRGCSDSQARPFFPKRSVAGHRGIK